MSDESGPAPLTELPGPLLDALDLQHGKLLRLVDPRSQQAYILIRADLLARLQETPDDDWDGIDVGALIDEVMREDDADDPYLESYQSHKEKP